MNVPTNLAARAHGYGGAGSRVLKTDFNAILLGNATEYFVHNDEHVH